MLRKCAAVLAVVLCLANVNAGRAEPDSVVKWLMNEPASLFDTGILNLRAEVFGWSHGTEFDLSGQEWSVFNESMRAQYGSAPRWGAWYSWEENRIIIGASQSGRVTIDSKDKAKQACSAILDRARHEGGVEPQTGELLVPAIGHSLFANRFAHQGYESINQPDNYQSQLDKIFVLQAEVALFTEYSTKCRSPLLSNKVYFEE
jgi:hypothetical protein